MRVLLVRPHPELRVAQVLQKGFLNLEPLDLEIVAGGVPDEDNVSILDLSLEKQPFDALRREVSANKPDFIGFTGYSSHARMIKKLAGICKEILPGATTIVGGIHATIAAADYRTPDIDIVVRGEGGTAMRDLVARFKAGKSLHCENRAISTKHPDFQSLADSPPPMYPSWDQVPRPRRNIVKRSRYFSVWTSSPTQRLESMFPQVATLRTSVGCAFTCSFCVVHYMLHRKYLERTPEDVVDEIAGLSENHIYFVDDEMFLNPVRITRIAEMLIERNIKKQYISWARSDTIVRHPEVFRLWKKAGLSTVYVGIVAMYYEQLADYNNKTNTATNRHAVQVLKDIGITLHASFLVNPDFTVEKFQRLEKEISTLTPAEVTFTVMSPPPGTPLWHQHKHEFICDPYLFYDCMHTLLKTALPLPRFYAHFSHLYSLAMRANPLRVNRIRVPLRELGRAMYMGTKYVLAFRAIYRDYENHEYRPDHPG